MPSDDSDALSFLGPWHSTPGDASLPALAMHWRHSILAFWKGLIRPLDAFLQFILLIYSVLHVICFCSIVSCKPWTETYKCCVFSLIFIVKLSIYSLRPGAFYGTSMALPVPLHLFLRPPGASSASLSIAVWTAPPLYGVSLAWHRRGSSHHGQNAAIPWYPMLSPIMVLFRCILIEWCGSVGFPDSSFFLTFLN